MAATSTGRAQPGAARGASAAPARKNPGTPLVKVLTTVRWRGNKGKGTPPMLMATASTVA